MTTVGPAHTALDEVTLRVGEPAEVWVLGTDDEETYVSRIEDVAGQQLTLAAPLRKLQPVYVPVGREVAVRVPRPEGMFTATARVQTVQHSPVALLETQLVSPWRRQQRRAWVRLETRFQPERVDLAVGERSYPLNLWVASISAGGVRLVSNRQDLHEATDLGPKADYRRLQRVWRDATLHIDMTLDGTRVQATAEITRLEEVEDLDSFWYRLGARLALDAAQEDTVFHFVFDEQRRLRRVLG